MIRLHFQEGAGASSRSGEQPRAAASGCRPPLEPVEGGGQRPGPTLENTLGVRLLNRTTRRVSLTEIGRGYYERCVQVLQDLVETVQAAGAEQATPR